MAGRLTHVSWLSSCADLLARVPHASPSVAASCSSLACSLVRLGVPTVQLDMQGRARPSLAKLYNWCVVFSGGFALRDGPHPMPRSCIHTPSFSLPPHACLATRRYSGLGDLPMLLPRKAGGTAAPDSPFLRANAGLVHEMQLVDVGDYGGRGESTPLPYFYQVSVRERRTDRRGRAALVPAPCPLRCPRRSHLLVTAVPARSTRAPSP
jgi:hypothetical protein